MNDEPPKAADGDRPLRLERLADDMADVLTQIGVERAGRVVAYRLPGRDRGRSA